MRASSIVAAIVGLVWFLAPGEILRLLMQRNVIVDGVHLQLCQAFGAMMMSPIFIAYYGHNKEDPIARSALTLSHAVTSGLLLAEMALQKCLPEECWSNTGMTQYWWNWLLGDLAVAGTALWFLGSAGYFLHLPYSFVAPPYTVTKATTAVVGEVNQVEASSTSITYQTTATKLVPVTGFNPTDFFLRLDFLPSLLFGAMMYAFPTTVLSWLVNVHTIGLSHAHLARTVGAALIGCSLCSAMGPFFSHSFSKKGVFLGRIMQNLLLLPVLIYARVNSPLIWSTGHLWLAVGGTVACTVVSALGLLNETNVTAKLKRPDRKSVV